MTVWKYHLVDNISPLPHISITYQQLNIFPIDRVNELEISCQKANEAKYIHVFIVQWSLVCHQIISVKQQGRDNHKSINVTYKYKYGI